MMSDHIFEGRAERFRDRIYGTAKGKLRLELVWRDMCEQLPLQGNALQRRSAEGPLARSAQWAISSARVSSIA